jgi:Ca2+/Na+ antiporter
MSSFKITKQVKRKTKLSAKVLTKLMLILTVVFILLAIAFTTGYMMFAFLFAALYLLFSTQVDREYEYNFENGILTIDVIKGKRRRKTVHTLNMKDLEVLAPNWHDAVARYRKNGGSEKLPKYDYTSYDEDIPYYTMIIMEDKKKIKLLLDLDGEMLDLIKRVYPQKVYLQ